MFLISGFLFTFPFKLLEYLSLGFFFKSFFRKCKDLHQSSQPRITPSGLFWGQAVTEISFLILLTWFIPRGWTVALCFIEIKLFFLIFFGGDYFLFCFVLKSLISPGQTLQLKFSWLFFFFWIHASRQCARPRSFRASGGARSSLVCLWHQVFSPSSMTFAILAELFLITFPLTASLLPSVLPTSHSTGLAPCGVVHLQLTVSA